MKRLLLLGVAALLLFLVSSPSGVAQDLVLNNGFEMQSTLYYTYYGNVPSIERGVNQKDVTAPGAYSWCFWQIPCNNVSGGLKQNINVIFGYEYTITADICYHNC